MSRKLLLLGLLALLIGTLNLASRVEKVRGSGTIYIRADGSIDPPTAPISTVDNVTYVFTADINNQSISVQRNNTTIDGRGHMLQGSYVNFSLGMNLSNVTNVAVENTRIDAFWHGIFLDSGSNHRISGNNITNNVDAIFLQSTANDSISGNIITNNKGWGVVFFDSHNETLFRNDITNNHDGVVLGPSSNDDISENNIANNTGDGIMLYGIFNQTTFKSSTTENNITNNNIKNNKADGIKLISSTNNTISRNNIIENQLAIEANYSSHNRIYNNNFVSNAQQVLCNSSWNTWDNGYPSGSNFWSDYNGTDANHDSIGDTSYIIDANNADNYPLMGMFSEFNVSLPYDKTDNVIVISNSTVSSLSLMFWLSSPYDGLQPGQPFVQFTSTGENGSVGFCRLMIPRTVLNSSSYIVLVDSQPVSVAELPLSNSTHVFLYFTYTHSAHEVIVTIPEFAPFLTLSLFMIATLLIVIVYRKRTHR
jgi:parallel beta-helix repeat protein